MIKEIADKIVDILFEHFIETFVDKEEDKVTGLLNEYKEKKQYRKCRVSLNEEVLIKYGDERFYDALCSVLSEDQNMDRLIRRCINRNVTDNETDEKLIEAIIGQSELEPYEKSLVKSCIEYISDKTFEAFNTLCDAENIKLKNIVISQGERTRKDIRNYGEYILENQEEILADIRGLGRKLGSESDVSIQAEEAVDITRGTRNAV